MRFYIETYGCTSNFGNSREAAEELSRLGHTPSSPDSAEVVIINSCAVTARTERRIRRRLCQIDGDRLVVAGCLPQAIPQSLEGIRTRGAVGVLNRSGIEELAALLDPRRKGRIERGETSDPSPLPEGGDGVGQEPTADCRKDLCGIVNISEGCLGRCSYCIVRKARGQLTSRCEQEIVRRIRMMVQSGTVEIQLASQDASAYGRERRSSLPPLLDEVQGVPGSFKIRVGMMNPDTAYPIIDQLVRAFQNTKIYRFIHLPLQSGSERVLQEMNRGYSPEQFLEVVSRFKEAFPDLSLTTDVIAGYPGETEEDFEATLELLRKAAPDKVNVTRYSRRPGTVASGLYDMPDRIKKDRSRVLTRLWMDMAAKHYSRYEGKMIPVLVTERGRNGTAKARADNYLGVVIQGQPDLGSLVNVKITDTNPHYLTGIIVNEEMVSGKG